jgi:hypothetical protein
MFLREKRGCTGKSLYDDLQKHNLLSATDAPHTTLLINDVRVTDAGDAREGTSLGLVSLCLAAAISASLFQEKDKPSALYLRAMRSAFVPNCNYHYWHVGVQTNEDGLTWTLPRERQSDVAEKGEKSVPLQITFFSLPPFV